MHFSPRTGLDRFMDVALNERLPDLRGGRAVCRMPSILLPTEHLTYHSLP